MKRSFFKKLVYYGVSFCVSYTLVSLILSLLNINASLVAGNFWIYNIEIMSVCFCIALLMWLTDTFIKGSSYDDMTPLGIFADLMDVALPVIGLGGFVFDWFDVFSKEILYPIIILLFVYFVVLGFFYLNAKMTEIELNKKIQERKKKLNNNKQDD